MNNNPFIWLIAIPLIASPLIYFSGHLAQRKLKISLSQIAALIALLVTWIPFVQTVNILQQADGISFSVGAINLNFDGDLAVVGRRHPGTRYAGCAVLPGLPEG